MFIFTITSHITIVWLLSVISLSTSPHLSPLHLLFSSLAPSIPKPSLYYSPYLTLKIDAIQLRPFLPSSSLLAEQFLERLTSNHKLLQLVQSFLLSQAQYPPIESLLFIFHLFQLSMQMLLVASRAFLPIFAQFDYNRHQQL